MAEAVRFELTVSCPTPVFKTGTFSRSVTLPLMAAPLGLEPRTL